MLQHRGTKGTQEIAYARSHPHEFGKEPFFAKAAKSSPYIDPNHIAPAGSASPHGQLVPATGIAYEPAVEVPRHSGAAPALMELLHKK